MTVTVFGEELVQLGAQDGDWPGGRRAQSSSSSVVIRSAERRIVRGDRVDHRA